MARSIDFSWLDLQGPERRQLGRQPVVLVLTALRFFPVLKVDQREFIAPFQESIRRDFPVFDQAPKPPPIQVQIPGMVLEPTANVPPAWLFRDVSRDWTITLSQDTLGFETRSYAGFEDYRARLAPVLEALIAHIVPTLATRIGLRFLDELRPLDQKISVRTAKGASPIQWGDIVRPELLGVAGMPVFQGRIQQSLQQLILRDENGVGVNINHGIAPGGSLVDPPSASSMAHGNGPFYALDLDAFQEFDRGKELPVNAPGVLERLDAFHDALSRIFRWSLNEEHIGSLWRGGSS